MDVIWDMETGDPDDFLTLFFLLGHPRVNLKAVTITPGGADQVGVVRWALEKFERSDIRVGTFHDPRQLQRMDCKQTGQGKTRVSQWHYKVYGDIPPSYNAERAIDVLREELGPHTTMITGGPLKNLGALLREGGDSPLGRLFVQGGFAGQGVVPEDWQLPKFKGMTVCPTYNLNGDPKSALLVLGTNRFSEKRFVSKNVCHGVYYDQSMHDQFTQKICSTHSICDCPCHEPRANILHVMACCTPCSHCEQRIISNPEDRTQNSWQLIVQGMSAYLKKKPEGKKFHDPLAAACALDPDIGIWQEVELYRQRGQWGSFVSPGSGTQIITGYDHERFLEVLLGA